METHTIPNTPFSTNFYVGHRIKPLSACVCELNFGVYEIHLLVSNLLKQTELYIVTCQFIVVLNFSLEINNQNIHVLSILSVKIQCQ